MQLLTYVELQLVIDSILVVLFTATLIKVCNGSALRLVNWLVILLIVSNISAISVELLTLGTFVNTTHTTSVTADVALAVSYCF